MRSLETIATAIFVTGMLAAAPAASARPLRYDCDTAIGSFSQLETDAEGPGFRITGRVTPVARRDDRRWLPSAMIRIEDAADNWLAIRIAGARSNRFEVRLATGTGGRFTERAFTTVELGSALPFELSLSPAGEAVALAGGVRAEARARIGTGAKLLVTCSTGEFLFEALDFEAAAPR